MDSDETYKAERKSGQASLEKGYVSEAFCTIADLICNSGIVARFDPPKAKDVQLLRCILTELDHN